MRERTVENHGIADYVVARRKRKDCFWDENDRHIDWKPLEDEVSRKIGQQVRRASGWKRLGKKGMVAAFS